jgi:hypothetical protein
MIKVHIALNIHASRKTLPETLRGIGKRGIHVTTECEICIKQVNIGRCNEIERVGVEICTCAGCGLIVFAICCALGRLSVWVSSISIHPCLLVRRCSRCRVGVQDQAGEHHSR